MNEQLERRIALVREWLPDMNDQQRMEVFRTVMDGYCAACGSAHLPCFCTRDD